MTDFNLQTGDTRGFIGDRKFGSRMRKSQVSTGDRSAKIRTYNYPQSRVTDHRIGFTTHDLTGVMDGEMDALMDALHLADIEERLAGD